MTAPPDADRAVARRVLRSYSRTAAKYAGFAPHIYCSCRGCLWYLAAVDGARAGREYRAKEIKADADATHARVEGRMLDRQIAHFTKGSK